MTFAPAGGEGGEVSKRRVVTAYAKSCSGPGWANAPVWIIVRDELGNLHEECLQPDEQSTEIATLYRVCAAANYAMSIAAARVLKVEVEE